MDEPLWPLGLYALLVLALVAGMLSASWLLGERRRGRHTNEPFESGVPPVGDARIRFSAKFFLVAVFFVIFDLETVYLVAWAIAVREAGWAGFVEAALFVLVLLAALAYLWREGALEWAPHGGGRRREP